MASIDLLGPSGRARFAWLFLRPLAGLELPAVGVGEQACLDCGWVVAQGCHGWDWLAGQAGLADDLRPARSPAQQQAEPVAGADDDERGPDKQQRNFCLLYTSPSPRD